MCTPHATRVSSAHPRATIALCLSLAEHEHASEVKVAPGSSAHGLASTSQEHVAPDLPVDSTRLSKLLFGLLNAVVTGTQRTTSPR